MTNDWFTGLIPAYAKTGAFGSVFSGTTFIHLIHNLGEGYQGLIYPERPGDMLNYIHQLNNEFLVDPMWDRAIINPSRCALLASGNQPLPESKTNRIRSMGYRFEVISL